MQRLADTWLPDGEQHFQDYLRKTGGEYQPKQRNRSLEYVTRWSLAIDIGAHVGLWSRALVQRFKRVVAFEPLAPLRACLERNVESPRLEIVPMALGNTHGAVALGYEGCNSGAARILPDQRGLVPLGRLDDFEFDEVGYIKIDTEGFELEVLRGAERTLRRCRPIVVVEEKAHGAVHFNQPRYAAVRFLESLGATVLDRIVDDFILGWADTPGMVRPVAPLPFEKKLAAALKLHQAADADGAELAYRNLLRDQPRHPEVRYLLACAAWQLKRPDQAIAMIEELLAIEPRCAAYHRTLADFLRHSGRAAEAAAPAARADEAAAAHDQSQFAVLARLSLGAPPADTPAASHSPAEKVSPHTPQGDTRTENVPAAPVSMAGGAPSMPASSLPLPAAQAPAAPAGSSLAPPHFAMTRERMPGRGDQTGPATAAGTPIPQGGIDLSRATFERSAG